MNKDDIYIVLLSIVAILFLAIGFYLHPSESLTAVLREFGGY